MKTRVIIADEDMYVTHKFVCKTAVSSMCMLNPNRLIQRLLKTGQAQQFL